MTSVSGKEIIENIDQIVKKEFDSNRRILSFDEYLMLLAEGPENQLRGSAQYIADMMDYYGKYPNSPHALEDHRQESRDYRFKLFDESFDSVTPTLVGHEEVQTQIYRSLRSFVRQKGNNRLVLLHGPNGSAKSTIIRSLMNAMEKYSNETEGAVYTFNWIFPVEKTTKKEMGLKSYSDIKEETDSFAKLPDEQTAARISSEMKDHPFLLIPVEQRKKILEELLGKQKASELWEKMPDYLTHGGLSHRSKQIFDALLTANNGNYRKVMRHIQVERFYYSRRYRKGLVTIEPRMHVDAHYSQLTYNKSIGSLPPSLQSLNFFTLNGDLVDGNRGIVEYSDLLKRPVESFKYLLGACETGSVNVGESNAYLDTVMLGSSNELQLDAFKEFPDFSSFKARIELVRVPYLLSVKQEQKIYDQILDHTVLEKHVAPHVSWALSLWAVLTRLKKPNSINYPPHISSLITHLTPLEKAKLYDEGEMPMGLSPDDRKLLRSNYAKIRNEYSNIPYYEGRMGASVREIKSLLFEALQNSSYKCLSPLSIFEEIEKFIKHVSEYEFLKQDVKDGYHDAGEFIQIVKDQYLSKVDREVRDCIGLYDAKQWESFLEKYILHISHILKKEKLHNPMTGKYEDPDQSIMKEFEKIVDAPKEQAALDTFRNNFISRVGAWSLDHPKEKVVYSKVFPEYWAKLEKHYYDSQKDLLIKMNNALVVFDSDRPDKKDESYSEGHKLARQTTQNLKSRFGYCDHCAKEVVTYLMRKRY